MSTKKLRIFESTGKLIDTGLEKLFQYIDGESEKRCKICKKIQKNKNYDICYKCYTKNKR